MILMNKIFKAQVVGAFYKEGLGEIDLVWGEITDFKNHKGYGLSHIIDKHTNFDLQKIPEIIEKGELINQNNTRYRIQKDDYVIGLSAEYKGEKRNFIITAFERNKGKSDTFTERPFTQTSDNAVKNLGKENGESLYASSPITKGETLPLNSAPHSIINNPDANTIIKKLKDYRLDNHMNIGEYEINNLRKELERLLNINPIKEFGKNYAEYYQDGKGAIKKLMDEYKEFERFNKKTKKRAQKKVRC